MHFMMILSALSLAWCLRGGWFRQQGSWATRWQRTLFFFLFPPLLLTMTAVAVLYMGPRDTIGGQPIGRLSYLLASGFSGLASIFCLKLAAQGWQSWRQTRTYPRLKLMSRWVRVLDTPVPFCAQIGFWRPELVASQGLLNTLDKPHLEAVFIHEQGHAYYRDTFWFFWLGWVRSYTTWLPNTEALWQELLSLRERRADYWAAQQVDPLLLAESLLAVVSTLPVQTGSCCAAFSLAAPRGRLQERIEALCAPDLSPP
ncbi:MAG TPA: M56 family metallopeptidase, partial [Candidatus Caenarcaniphilales bacterium]